MPRGYPLYMLVVCFICLMINTYHFYLNSAFNCERNKDIFRVCYMTSRAIDPVPESARVEKRTVVESLAKFRELSLRQGSESSRKYCSLLQRKFARIVVKCREVRDELFRELSHESLGKQRTKFAHFVCITFSQYCKHIVTLWKQLTCSTNKTKTSPVLCSCAASKHTQTILEDTHVCS